MSSPSRPPWRLAVIVLALSAGGCQEPHAAPASEVVTLVGVAVHQEPAADARARWFDVDFTVRRREPPAAAAPLALDLAVWAGDRQPARAERRLAVDLGGLAAGEERRYSVRVTDLAYEPGDRFTLALASTAAPDG